MTQARFTRVLERFYGLHAAWEPAMAARPPFAELIAGRTRLAHLRDDLARLGRSPAEIAALPACPMAAELAATPHGAWGSLYVLEGSTLGGKLIARALAAAAWPPPGGLTYFDARGSETGRMWRSLAEAADAAIPPQAWPKVADGAAQAFDLVRAWTSTAGAEARTV